MSVTKSKKANPGFTLVELLVVIGIIALLISILLPSLNRARAAAKSIKCKASLHDIGNLIAEYSAQNRGCLPWGYVTAPYNNGNNHWYSNNAKEWTWCDTLSIMLTRKTRDQDPSMAWAANSVSNMALDYAPIFHDTDTLAGSYANRASDYIANPRLMSRNYDQDPIATLNGQSGYMPQRKSSSVTQASSRMMVWDSGVRILPDGLSNGAADLVDTNIDLGSWGWGHGMATTGAASWYNASSQDNMISIGNTAPYRDSINNNVTIDIVKQQNHDSTNQYYNGDGASMRFRHMLNTEANVLFVDGHVEGRLLGSVKQRDILVNPVPWINTAP